MNPRDKNPPRPIIAASFFLAAILIQGAILPASASAAAAGGRTRATAETRLNLSWEYDNNVFEERSNKTPGGAGLVSLFSRVRFKSPGRLTRLNYHLGYKGHYRMGDQDNLTAGDVLVHKLSLDTEKVLSHDWSAGAGGELKLRNIYRKNKLNLLSEEGYIRGSGRLFTRRRIERFGTLCATYRYSFYDFETFDTFNYRAHSPGLKVSRRLSPAVTGSLGYSFTRRSYRRLISRLAPDGSLVLLDKRQQDNYHQIDLSLAYSRLFLVNFIYSLQRNDSNNFGFSYWNNRFSLLFARKLPHEFFLNAYLFFELKRYSDMAVEPIMVGIITEENDNNGVIVKLSRPLGKSLEAAVTFSFYRNQSSIRDLNFNKNLLNFGLTHRF